MIVLELVGAGAAALRMGFGAMPMVPTMPMGAMPGAMLGNAMMEEDAKAKEAKEAQEAKEKEAKEEEAQLSCNSSIYIFLDIFFPSIFIMGIIDIN